MSPETTKEEQAIIAIRERYQRVLNHIVDATAKAGRAEGAVRLVVVTKSQPMEIVKAVIAAGATTLGENYVEEAVEKIASIVEPGVEWHMIGHVQSRKAELTAKYFSIMQSLDNGKLAGKLNRFCIEYQRTLPVMLEFNVSGEESKFGFPAWDEDRWPELTPEIEQVLTLSNLVVKGLMTMPPYSVDPENSRPYFQRLRKLQAYLTERFPEAEWKELSMGTSIDFTVAIQEGATYVRIGEAITGPRQKKI